MFRGDSAVLVRPNTHFTVNNWRTQYGSVEICYRTQYVHERGQDAPRQLWAEARGIAPSLDEAAREFAASVHSILPALSFATNATTSTLELHLCFDSTTGHARREFVQNHLHEPAPVHYGRSLPADSTVALLEAVNTSAIASRLQRALAHYWLALRNWTPGSEILALAPLFMGAETLARPALESELARRRVSRHELAASLDVPERDLEAWARRALIFGGDEECHRRAKKASDGFEHGFLSFKDIHTNAAVVRDRTAHYLRMAILRMAGVPNDARHVLASTPYDGPCGAWRFTRQFRATLEAADKQLAAPDQQYPMCTWRSELRSTRWLDCGTFIAVYQESLGPRLGPGVQFRPLSLEVRAQLLEVQEPQAPNAEVASASLLDLRGRAVHSLTELLTFVREMAPGEVQNICFSDHIQLSLFWRLIARVDTLCVLLRSQRAEDGIPLLHQVLSDTLRLVYIMESPDLKGERSMHLWRERIGSGTLKLTHPAREN